MRSEPLFYVEAPARFRVRFDDSVYKEYPKSKTNNDLVKKLRPSLKTVASPVINKVTGGTKLNGLPSLAYNQSVSSRYEKASQSTDDFKELEKKPSITMIEYHVPSSTDPRITDPRVHVKANKRHVTPNEITLPFNVALSRCSTSSSIDSTSTKKSSADSSYVEPVQTEKKGSKTLRPISPIATSRVLKRHVTPSEISLPFNVSLSRSTTPSTTSSASIKKSSTNGYEESVKTEEKQDDALHSVSSIANPRVLKKKKPQPTERLAAESPRTKKKIPKLYSSNAVYDTTIKASAVEFCTGAKKVVWADPVDTGEYVSFLPSMEETKDRQEIFRRQGVVHGYAKRTIPHYEVAVAEALRRRKKAQAWWNVLGREDI